MIVTTYLMYWFEPISRLEIHTIHIYTFFSTVKNAWCLYSCFKKQTRSLVGL